MLTTKLTFQKTWSSLYLLNNYFFFVDLFSSFDCQTSLQVQCAQSLFFFTYFVVFLPWARPSFVKYCTREFNVFPRINFRILWLFIEFLQSASDEQSCNRKKNPNQSTRLIIKYRKNLTHLRIDVTKDGTHMIWFFSSLGYKIIMTVVGLELELVLILA